MTRTKTTFLALLSVFLSPQVAVCDVITFDELEAPGSGFESLGTSYDVGGFRFQIVGGDGGGILLSQQQSGFSYNGSAALFAANSADIVMSQIDGMAFSVTSVDIDRLFASSGVFDFIGQLIGGGSVMQQFTGDSILGNQNVTLTSFQNLTSLTFGGVGSFGFANIGSLDNIDLETVSVPEPGTLALLGIGLFGMGLARRNKKA